MSRRPSPFATPSLRRVAVVAALVTVTCPLAACGKGDTESWVGTFCGVGVSLRTVLTGADAQLEAQLAAAESPGAIEASVVADADPIAAAATAAKARIEGSGDPSVAQGTYIQPQAVFVYEQIATEANAFPGQVGSISATNASTLTAGVGPFGEQVADLSRRVAGSSSELQGPKGYAELEKVSRTPGSDTHLDETCAQLQAPSS